MEIVIASKNLHKVREYRAILKTILKCDILSLHDFPDYSPPEEVGSTFVENASSKAIHAAKALGKWVIGDDSGLVVPALGNQPGIFSARFAGKDATDKDNRNKLLEELNKIADEERTGYYECALCLASSDGLKKCVIGLCEGSIIESEKGRNGFGYDPLFVKYDYNKTFAELDEETKNRISHRRKAIDKMLPSLETLLLS
ncbi:MAG: RdgB/HAM1 family non-canonical purine NTP pyrophosphatase [Simkaniaceae bacterium]|nr:RdgB/HAM1 family non-canonical purine NTP pyrophosphatase [Simkaniaceae bacterium]